MTMLDVAAADDLGHSYAAPYCTARGEIRSRLFQPSGCSIWKVEGHLAGGAELEWGTDHGDEVVFVVSGELDFDGARCATDGAIVVEAGVGAVVRASTDTTVLHFGPVERESPSDGPLGPAAAEGRTVHVVSAEEAAKNRAGTIGYFTDGSCPTCRIAFFVVDFPIKTVPSHHHSEDEIFHVLDGSMQVGRDLVLPGQAVAVPAGRRYGFHAPEQLRFLTYRRDVSTLTTKPGSEPIIETREGMLARMQG